MTPAQIQQLNIRQQQQFHLRTEMQPNKAFNCQDGTERIYYHTKTCMPILADEIDIDSDCELDPDWLKEYTTIQINDFDDVNRGEKDLMQLWNLHFLRSIYIADNRMCEACEEFIDANIRQLVEMKLIRNFFVHLRSLYDYRLLKVTQLTRLIDYVVAKEQELLSAKNTSIVKKTGEQVVKTGPRVTSHQSQQLTASTNHAPSSPINIKLEANEQVVSLKNDSFHLTDFIRNTINKSPLASKLLGRTFYTRQTPSPSKPNGLHSSPQLTNTSTHVTSQFVMANSNSNKKPK